MIYGIGTDILAVARIERLYRQYGDAAARRILSETEQPEFQAAADKARFLAKRFAAKEAFAKAVGTGLRGAVGMRSITVAHDDRGKPLFEYADELDAYLAEAGIGRVHLSLSDEQEYVAAFALAEAA